MSWTWWGRQMKVFNCSMEEHTMEFSLLQERWRQCELIAGSGLAERLPWACAAQKEDIYNVPQLRVWRLTPTDIIDVSQTSQICICTIQGHVLLIYFEGSSVQFLNHDCRLKISEDDGYIYSDQVQVIALFSLTVFYSDYNVLLCILYSWCLDY